MGSPPTLDPTRSQPPDLDRPDQDRELQARHPELLEHLQTPAALGVRVAVHDLRQNDRNPVIWQPGQDYRMADALHTARTHPTPTRWGPERLGPER